MERDPLCFRQQGPVRHFNSHAHVERDGKILYVNLELDNFNSHAHVERDEGIPKALADLMNFNSHAHVERDPATDKQKAKLEISTHTLTWSVTRVLHVRTLQQ